MRYLGASESQEKIEENEKKQLETDKYLEAERLMKHNFYVWERQRSILLGGRYRPVAILCLDDLAGLHQAVEDVGGGLAGVELRLLLLELLVHGTELRELCLEVSSLHLRVFALDLDLGSRSPPLRADLQHVGANAVLDYILR